MSPAPILKGYACRFCGQERIETPWDASDGFHCANCGVTNWGPLPPVGHLTIELIGDIGPMPR